VIGGPVRPARRSEKHPSLVRVESINGKNADEVAPAVPGKEASAPRPKATLPTERFALGNDPTLAQIEKVAPIGRGSRVVLHGGPHSGKSTAARLLGAALKASGAQVFTALAGIREEEQADWAAFEPIGTETIDSSPDNRAKAVERALDKARRAAGNAHAVLIVDSADDLPGASVRKTLGAAKFLPGSGSLTVIVVAKAPLGGETTVVGFDQALAGAGKFPSIKVRASSTLRPDLLIDARSLRALHKAHSDAVKKDK
jgi:transcription termination factor Rho